MKRLLRLVFVVTLLITFVSLWPNAHVRPTDRETGADQHAPPPAHRYPASTSADRYPCPTAAHRHIYPTDDRVC